MAVVLEFSPLSARYFVLREESPGMWTSTLGCAGQPMQEIHTNSPTGMYAYAYPDTIRETTPARASWDLWDEANQVWIERPYPEDWNGLVAGGDQS